MIEVQGEKAQSAVEIIIIAVVLLGFVLITYSVVMQRNAEAERILGIQRDNERCQEISGIVTEFNAGESYTETKISNLEKDVRLEKGSVIIQSDVSGSITCRYSGTAWFEESEDVYVEDSEGFDLAKERGGASASYKVKRLGMGVVFCDYAEAWC